MKKLLLLLLLSNTAFADVSEFEGKTDDDLYKEVFRNLEHDTRPLPLDFDYVDCHLTCHGTGHYDVDDKPSSVPLPAAVWLFGAGMMTILYRKRSDKN